jgi:hypothetical protein
MEVAEAISECRDIFRESTGRADVDVRVERYGGPRTFYRVTCLLPPADRSTCICTNPVVAVRAAFADLARR